MAHNDTRLIVPTAERRPWPTLGFEVCDWIEANLVHGPGDVLGKPIVLSDEMRAIILRAYEVYPRGHEQAGRRRFKTVVVSRRKGWAKTELAELIAIAEMDPSAPVRCDGWRPEDSEWVPVGKAVNDPYIPMVAYTEEQAEDLAYGGALAILTSPRCRLVDDYDCGLERIVHKRHPGKIAALASAPDARDGARTSFQHKDETHRWTTSRLRRASQTLDNNIPKRRGADPWTLETTTMFAPGERSVAEDAYRFAQQVRLAPTASSRLYYDHLQASERHDLRDDAQLRAAIIEASGDAVAYADIPSIAAMFRDPTKDEADLRRFWLNQPRRSSQKWTAVTTVWADHAESDHVVDDDTKVVLFFDGSYSRDSTALIGATVEERPHIFVVKVWEKPLQAGAQWRTPRNEVDDAVVEALARWRVVELAADPPGWHREIEDWETSYGEVVVRFDTNQPARFGPACDSFEQAVCAGELSHDGSEVLARHLDNVVPVRRRGYLVITKASPGSADKIDAAVGAVGAHHRACWHYANRRATARPWVAFG